MPPVLLYVQTELNSVLLLFGFIYTQFSVNFLLCCILQLGRQQITALAVADFFEREIPVRSSVCHLVVISSVYV
jgi:hypothetical protein